MQLTFKTILLAILVLILLAIGVYALFIRPRVMRLGLTGAELHAALPGDDYVPNPRWGFTQAINIHAPPEAVWPWLVQMGYQRAGWYSLDAVEKAIGAGDFIDGHSSNRIVPELQGLKVGDVIKIAEPLPYTVTLLEPNRVMMLHVGVNSKTNQPIDVRQPLPPDYLNTSWTFYLQPVDARTTRLFVRFVFDAPPTLANTLAFGLFTEGGAAFMSPNQLKGIKQRAEAYYAAGQMP